MFEFTWVTLSLCLFLSFLSELASVPYMLFLHFEKEIYFEDAFELETFNRSPNNKS